MDLFTGYLIFTNKTGAIKSWFSCDLGKKFPEPLNSELVIWEYFRAKEYERQMQMGVEHSEKTR